MAKTAIVSRTSQPRYLPRDDPPTPGVRLRRTAIRVLALHASSAAAANLEGMHLTRLALTDFRSYVDVNVPLAPGVSIFSGQNGEGKTNLIKAVGYAATLIVTREQLFMRRLQHRPQRVHIEPLQIGQRRAASSHGQEYAMNM